MKKKLKKKSSSVVKISIVKTRTYATVVYPDSAPSNWLELLSDIKCPCFVSPLHDRDFNANGEPKKPHYHVMFIFDGPKTIEQFKNLIVNFAGVGVEVINSVRSYARYLCHLDNPEKAQYDIRRVQTFGALDYHDIINTSLDKYKAIKEMMIFCTDNNIYSFAKLSIYASEYQFEWFKVLCDCGALFMKEFLKSAYLDLQNGVFEKDKIATKKRVIEEVRQ